MTRTFSFLSYTLCSFIMLGYPAIAAVKIGVVGAADDTVNIVSDKGEKRIIALGDPIFANDTITTDNSGKAQLIFLDRSTITINESSEIKIDKFIYNPEKSDGEMAVNSVKGAFRFIGGALSKKKEVKIKTPVATIGIRGGIADTHIAADGTTETVFLFGDQLSVTNANGDIFTTQDIGSGLSMSDAFSAPTELPDTVVNTRINSFSTTNSNGGGATTKPNANTINMNLNTGTKQPMPITGNVNISAASGAMPQTIVQNSIQNNSSLGATPTANSSLQNPAPIMMVNNENLNVMEVMGALSSQVATQTLTDTMQAASENPELLASFTNAPRITELFVPNSQSDGTGVNAVSEGLDITQELTDDPAPDEAIEAALDEVAGDTGAPAEIFTNLATQQRGEFWLIDDGDVEGELAIKRQGFAVMVAESQNYYQIDLADNAPTDVIPVQLPKLTNPGFTQFGDIIVKRGEAALSPSEPASEYTRSVIGFRSKFGGMNIYKTDSVDPLDTDKELNFIVGEWVIDPTDAVTTFQAATARSKTYADNVTNTNGVLFYDFVPELGNGHGDNDLLGAYEYNIADAGVTTEALDADDSRFGMAIDWKDNNGERANLFSGNVKWLTEHGEESVAQATFGGTDALGNGIIKGRHMYYKGTRKGDLEVDAAGTYNHKGIRINQNIFGKAGKPIEGAIVDYRTPADAAGTANLTLNEYFNGTLNTTTDLINAGSQAISLQNTPISEDIRQSTQNGPPAATTIMNGFASGVMLQGTTTANMYEPKVFSNRDEGLVEISPNNLGFVEGFIEVSDNNALNTGTTRAVKGQFALGKSVYVSDKLYASQQNEVDHYTVGINAGPPITETNNLINIEVGNEASQGFIVSSGVINNASDTVATRFGNDYSCTDCKFVHWGVWAGSLGKKTGDITETFANMVPYVAGDITQEIATLANKGTATYKGEAYATIYRNAGAVADRFNPENIAGKVDAEVNIDTLRLTKFNLDFGNNVRGDSLKMKLQETIPGTADLVSVAGTGNAVFQGGLYSDGVKLQDNGGTNAIAGSMNGAIFGTNAQEIGGNYKFERADNVKGGGIYLGKDATRP